MTASGTSETFDGGCACGAVRYAMHGAPMFVHCCHCRDCQRLTGSAFVVNALIETERLSVLRGEPTATPVPTASGRPHESTTAPPAGPRCGATTAAARPFASSASEPSTIRSPCRRTCTSSPARSCPGWSFPRMSRPFRSTTTCGPSGPPRASPGEGPSWATAEAPLSRLPYTLVPFRRLLQSLQNFGQVVPAATVFAAFACFHSAPHCFWRSRAASWPALGSFLAAWAATGSRGARRAPRRG